ncbi:MAG: N-acetylglucosamine-6-phosphate deacetylase [Arachnia propionica]|nr:MAG: N-acetylglucosamine-6-phosphate deacetylase [Arachnia propionica]
MQEILVSRAVTPAGVLSGARILVRDGRIAAIEAADVAPDGLWAVPGFVDSHSHGAVGVSYGDPDLAANRRAIDFHRQHGSTTIIASTVTEPLDKLVAQIKVLRELVEAGDLAGIHLEGPFLAEAKKGAHDINLLCDPTLERVETLLEAGGDAIAMITMAVERDHMEAAIRRFTEAGVRVAFGHSDATADIARASFDWGACISTHLFNAMRPIHHREPGAIPALLTDERIMNELICDGVHLAADIAAMAIAACGVERTALVTDAMSATGIGDGDYVLGDLAVKVQDGTARLVTSDGSPGAIAGSTLTMDRAFKFVVSEVGLTIPEAAQVAATTPARWHGLSDVGALEVGRWADVCLVDEQGELQRVIRRGELIRG